MLGYIWVIGGLSASFLAATCLGNSVYSQTVQRKSISTLAGYVLVVLYALLWLFLTYPTEKRITSMMNNNVPVGSTKSQVKSFLNARQIAYSEVSDNELMVSEPDGLCDTGETGFSVYFYFDQNNKMSKFEVQCWDTRTE